MVDLMECFHFYRPIIQLIHFWSVSNSAEPWHRCPGSPSFLCSAQTCTSCVMLLLTVRVEAIEVEPASDLKENAREMSAGNSRMSQWIRTNKLNKCIQMFEYFLIRARTVPLLTHCIFRSLHISTPFLFGYNTTVLASLGMTSDQPGTLLSMDVETCWNRKHFQSFSPQNSFNWASLCRARVLAWRVCGVLAKEQDALVKRKHLRMNIRYNWHMTKLLEG